MLACIFKPRTFQSCTCVYVYLFLGGVVSSSGVKRPVAVVINKFIHTVSSLTNQKAIYCLHTTNRTGRNKVHEHEHIHVHVKAKRTYTCTSTCTHTCRIVLGKLKVCGDHQAQVYLHVHTLYKLGRLKKITKKACKTKNATHTCTCSRYK